MIHCQDSEQVESFNYLGVANDQNIAYNVHVENVINKISQSLGVLKRASLFGPLQVRVTLYNTLVLPYFYTFAWLLLWPY